jgi:hypothetical protein
MDHFNTISANQLLLSGRNSLPVPGVLKQAGMPKRYVKIRQGVKLNVLLSKTMPDFWWPLLTMVATDYVAPVKKKRFRSGITRI